jgi:hypothetical protein
MLSLPLACRCLALLLCVALAGCASLDKYSFQTFGRAKQPSETYASNARSDELALIYADYVAQLLEGRSTGARITRELSDSSLAIATTLTAAHETLKITAETLAYMGTGVLIVREMQKIFNAQGRSEAFADAAYLIRQAQSEYRQYNPNPSATNLTENGAILVSRVDGALHAARKTLNGRMPGLLDLQQATQPMTEKGAERESSGPPQTMFTASGVKERVAKVEAMTVRQPKTVSAEEYAALLKKLGKIQDDLPVNVAFVAGMRKINDSTKLTPDQKTALWTKIVGDAQVTESAGETPNAIIKFFKDKATPAERAALTAALNNNLPADL